ncbi:MAG TPA: LPXTG cell wall anchor domain-containing protein [Anaerolineaceae bacterium]|nr:LPXTG cell wall anchor domain-containing protein [Anaerolineaceae bacterium]
MRWVGRIIGFLFVLIGLVWILQGTNVLLGSFMSGQMQFTILGVIVAILGAALFFFSSRRKAS